MRGSRNFLQGKMNKDLDERLLPKGQYPHAENIRIISSEGSDAGAVENVLGNQQVTNFSLGTNAVRVGSCVDNANGVLYWMVVSDTGSYILEYDTVNNTQAVVLEDTRSGSDNVLNFNTQYLITDARVLIDSDNNKKFLLFTDNLNPIRYINVARAKSLTANSFTNDDISLIKKPPLDAPNTTLSTVSTGGENNIEDKFLIFSHRYIYKDGEVSALSPFSKVAFQPKSFEFDYSTSTNESMINAYNAVDLSINVGPELVEAVEVVFKELDNNTVYSIGVFNKQDKSWSDNTTQTINFSNNKIYKVLPERELNRLFDNVPKKAKALEIIGNRVVLGNYTENYNLVDANNNKVVPKLSLERYTEETVKGVPYNTNKTDRDYEVGVVYGDAEGRHTTVLTAEDATEHIPITEADKRNLLRVVVNHKPPAFAKWFRFFIKQNRSTHDTIIPTVFYKDGTFVWLKINPADTNKVNEGDFLVLKRDASGLTLTRKEVKVLEKKNQPLNFLELDDTLTTLEQESGLYIKVKGTGIALDSIGADIHDKTVENRSGNTPATNNVDYITDLYFYGEGLNDVSISGTYTGTQDKRYTIQVTGSGTFNWTSDAGGSGTNVAFTAGNPVLIEDGISITFGSLSGYTLSDYWTFSAKDEGTFFKNTSKTYGFFESKQGVIEGGSSISIVYNEYNEEVQNFIYSFVASRDFDSLEEWWNEDGILAKIPELSAGRVKFRRGNLLLSTSFPIGIPQIEVDITGVEYLIIESIGIKNNAFDGTPKVKANLIITPPTNLVLESRGELNNSDVFYEVGDTYTIENSLHKGKSGDVSQTTQSPAIINLNVSNAYGWGNGIESSKIKGDFNSNKKTYQTRPLTSVDDYRENVRIASLTYGEVYQQTTSFNGINEFNLSLANFKDLDDAYGSIQKLFSRNDNLLVFQENKTQNILYNKNVIFNADGTGNVSQSNQVLGQEVPFSGEYGISKNPESFAIYGNQIWHADANRGCILRLGGDGYTEVSANGMKDYFRDYFRNYPSPERFAGYDPHYDEYILALPDSNLVSTNLAPQVGDLSLLLGNRTERSFTADDFTTSTSPAYFDSENNPADDLKIESLPSSGSLLYNDVAVTTGQVIPLADLSGNVLKYVPQDTDDYYEESFTFSVSDTASSKFSGAGTVFVAVKSGVWSVQDSTQHDLDTLPNSLISPSGIFMKASGDVLFILDNSSGKISQYSLTARDLSTITLSGESSSIYEEYKYRDVVGLEFNNTGNAVYTISKASAGFSDIKLFQHTVTSAWDITSTNLNQIPTTFFTIPNKVLGVDIPKGFRFTDSGNFFIYTFETVENGATKFYYRVYKCSAAFNISSPTLITEQEVTGVTDLKHPFSFDKLGGEIDWELIDATDTFLISFSSGALKHIDYLQEGLSQPLTGIGDVKVLSLVNSQYLIILSGVNTISIYDLNLTGFSSFDFTPPSIPSGLTLSSPTTTGYTLTSGVSIDADTPPVEYRLYKNNVAYGSWQSSNIFNITGEATGSQASWKVQARDSAPTPNESAFSGSSTFGTITATPTLVRGSETTTTITFDIVGVTGATRYRVEYMPFGGSFTLFDDNASSGEVTITGLTADTEHEIRVLAYNINNNASPYSTNLVVSTAAEGGGGGPTYTEVIMTVTGYATSGEACSGTPGSARYHNGILPWAGVGDTIFTDSNGNNTFNGQDLWFKMDNGFTVQINSSGVITAIEECQ